jgi:hypothetical protein
VPQNGAIAGGSPSLGATRKRRQELPPFAAKWLSPSLRRLLRNSACRFPDCFLLDEFEAGDQLL